MADLEELIERVESGTRAAVKSRVGELAADEVFAAWDQMDAAAQRILTAQPHQMSSAAEQLNAARLRMRSALQVAAYARDVLALKETQHDR